MALNPDNFKHLSTSEILEQLLQHVVKTEEELQKKKEERREQSTDLKVFISKKEGFELGNIEKELENIAIDDDTHQFTVDFINEHGFTETKLNEEASFLEIRTPSYERIDQSIFIDTGEYVRILTIERRYWTKRTVERVIDYLPGLSRLYLSSDDIKDIVKGLNEITKTDISGFTSKHRAYDENRRISIQFHGGDEDDIDHVRNEFQAKPTRVEFRQKNSPTDAVTGAVTRDARVNIPGIRAGSEEVGAETVNSVATKFEELDSEHFEIPYTPESKKIDDGLVIEGFTTIELRDKKQNSNSQDIRLDGGKTTENQATSEDTSEEDSFVKALRENIFESKQRYDFTEWMEDEDYLLFDKERNEMFQVGIDNKDLIIHARPGTTSVTLKEFCRIILEEFKTTYNIENRSTELVQS